ncbi:WD40 repeat domain-containing protein [Streptomyces boluensis]|uniref:WD40 repeat domain-containing protein n=1 Tax=Streptomyces boluensis TaxID=1775135 RepID=A0A964XMF4_9ACTN|nr:hypothetical protein [Streptomyces boluensis]NBE54474.1 hypothetical protein [Streptomyces boluensis]
MTDGDERLVTRYSGHTHGWHDTTAVVVLDGAPVAVSVDRDATLWVCGLLDGECSSRPLDLTNAEPEDAWYFEMGLWDEDDEDDDELRPRCSIDPYYICSHLAVGELDGRAVVITGGGRFDLSGADPETMGGAVRVWDLRTGAQMGKTLTGHDLGVTSLWTVPTEAGLLAVSSSEEGQLMASNLRSGEEVAYLRASFNGDMTAGLLGGRPVAVTGGHDDFVQVWDLLEGEQRGPTLEGIEAVARAHAVVEVDGRAMVVAGGDRHLLHRWDLESGEPLAEPSAGHTDRIHSLGTAHTADGRAIVVTGSNDDTSRIWDLRSGEQIGEPLAGQLYAVVELDEGPVAVTSAPKRQDLLVWDLNRAVG